MGHEISVRRAVAGDQTILAALGARVQELHARERPEVFKPVDPPGLERWFADALANGSSRIWIAHIGEKPVGYAVVIEQRRAEHVVAYARRWYEVEQIGVDPAYVRQGIARELLRHVTKAAIAEGVSEIELNTWNFNKVAHLSFERLGFVAKKIRFVRQIAAGQGEDRT